MSQASLGGWAAITLLIGSGGGAHAATAQRAEVGSLRDGRPIEAVTLSNGHGVSARVLTYGATLQSLVAPDRTGKLADITLGYDDARDYELHPNYFGVTVGRFANRIAKGRFVLDGKAYQLPLNNGPNSLHGGTAGFDKQVWRITSVVSSAKAASVTMALTSADGDSGYPGKLDVSVTENLYGDILSGEGSRLGVLDHVLTIPASRYTPVDPTLIPTGELRPVAGTAFDFRRGRAVGEAWRDGRDEQIRIGRGYDHNWVLDKGTTVRPELAARLEDPASGRVLEVLSTEPGLQMYTGNFLDGTLVGKQGHLYRMGDGMVLEPQKFPDAPNQPAFPSARVDPGTPYRHTMIFRVSTSPPR